MSVTKVRIGVRIHSHKVYTAVRIYANPYVFVEYNFFNERAPLKLIEFRNAHELIEYVREQTNIDGKLLDWKKEFSKDLKCTFEIDMYQEIEDYNYEPLFEVTHARHIVTGSGGKDIGTAYDNKSMRMRMIKYLFTLVEERNVEKIDSVLQSLRETFGK